MRIVEVALIPPPSLSIASGCRLAIKPENFKVQIKHSWSMKLHQLISKTGKRSLVERGSGGLNVNRVMQEKRNTREKQF